MKPANDNERRWMRHPNPIPRLTESEAHSFWLDVDASTGPDACWPWRGTSSGYGRVKIRGRLYLAHRVSFALANGGISDGEEYHGVVIRHKCDNPICCNPAHLIEGRQADNVRDIAERDRLNPRRGSSHPFACADEELVRDIRSSPLSGRKAAAHFGVSYGFVANVRSGRSWAHVSNDNRRDDSRNAA